VGVGGGGCGVDAPPPRGGGSPGPQAELMRERMEVKFSPSVFARARSTFISSSLALREGSVILEWSKHLSEMLLVKSTSNVPLTAEGLLCWCFRQVGRRGACIPHSFVSATADRIGDLYTLLISSSHLPFFCRLAIHPQSHITVVTYSPGGQAPAFLLAKRNLFVPHSFTRCITSHCTTKLHCSLPAGL